MADADSPPPRTNDQLTPHATDTTRTRDETRKRAHTCSVVTPATRAVTALARTISVRVVFSPFGRQRLHDLGADEPPTAMSGILAEAPPRALPAGADTKGHVQLYEGTMPSPTHRAIGQDARHTEQHHCTLSESAPPTPDMGTISAPTVSHMNSL